MTVITQTDGTRIEFDSVVVLLSFSRPHARGKAHIVVMDVLKSRKLQVVVTYQNGISDYPVLYDNGQIAYDHPEFLTDNLRCCVRAAFDWLLRTFNAVQTNLL